MSHSFAPSRTPKILKLLLGAVAALSALSPWVGTYFALGELGVKNLFLWQFVTYPFIHPFPSGILHLAFNLYLLWIFGTSLLEKLSTKAFLTLFFGTSIFAGLIAWGSMAGLNIPYSLYGSSTVLYGLLISWVILHPDAQLLLFFAMPFKARNLILGIIGLNLLIDLSRSQWIPVFAYLGAAFFGYMFTLVVTLNFTSLPFLARFERSFLRFIDRLNLRRKILPSKIYDIKSGEPVMNDEQFMDAMLARILRHGEDALSSEEKIRMQRISEKKLLEKE